MKNLIRISAVVWAAVWLQACTPDNDFSSDLYEYVGIRTTGLSTSILEDSSTPASIPLFYGGRLNNPTAFTVTYSISGGEYGVNYEVVGGSAATGTITIPEGDANTQAKANLQIQPIANSVKQPNVVLTVMLTQTSNNISIGYPLKSSFTLTISDDDCDFVRGEFTGVFNANEPGYGDYDIEFSADPDNENGIISDNFWDFGGVVKYVFDPATNIVTLPTQDVVMGGTTYVVSQGTGASTYNDCNKSFKVPYMVNRKSDNELQDSNVHTFTKK